MPQFVSDTSDFMSRSATLHRHGLARAHFDPTNEKHLESLRTYIRTGRWGDQQFFNECPFTDVPMTVLMKYASHVLGVERGVLVPNASA